MKKLGKILSNILLIFAIFILAATLYFVFTNKDNTQGAFLFGYKPYIIRTGSMEPTIKIHGIVVIKKCDISKIKENDIIAFVLPNTNTYVCHRAIQIQNGEITTKGDNNASADLVPVTKDNFIGKEVFKTNALQYLELQFKTTWGIIRLVGFILAIIIIIVILKILFDRKSAGKRYGDGGKE